MEPKQINMCYRTVADGIPCHKPDSLLTSLAIGATFGSWRIVDHEFTGTTLIALVVHTVACPTRLYRYVLHSPTELMAPIIRVEKTHPVFPSFWLVLADEPRLQATKRHESESDAKNEAARLAVKFPGRRFFVAHIEAACRSSQLVWETGAVAPELPF